MWLELVPTSVSKPIPSHTWTAPPFPEVVFQSGFAFIEHYLSKGWITFIILKNLLLWVSRSVMSISLQSMDYSMPGLPVHYQLPEFTQTHVHWVGDAIQPSHPLSSLILPPSVFPSIRVFSSASVPPIRWPNYWTFSFSISPSNEYSENLPFSL